MNYATLVLLTVLSLGAIAEDLPMAAPASLGFSAERLTAINEFAEREIAAGHVTGAVTLVARHGEVAHFATHGVLGVDNAAPMQKDTLFRIYSMTKPITTVAMMMLYEEGKFQLGDPVARYLPELGDMQVLSDGERVPPQSAMTIEQLMTHTAGLTYGQSGDEQADALFSQADLFNSRDLDEFVSKLAGVPLRFEPGSRYHYSVATDVLGALVERLSGLTLEQFFEQRIFAPLEMHDTFFNVPASKLDRLASIHYWNADDGALAIVPEDRVRPPVGVTLFSGGGGLVSSAMDYMIFCEMLRNGGNYNGTHILGPKTVQFMTLDHLTPAVRDEGALEYPAMHLYPGHSFGLGVSVITDAGQAGVTSSNGAYSWGGAANTKFWIDPEEDMVAIVMTQVLGSPWSDPTRFGMKIATYQALDRLGKPTLAN